MRRVRTVMQRSGRSVREMEVKVYRVDYIFVVYNVGSRWYNCGRQPGLAVSLIRDVMKSVCNKIYFILCWSLPDMVL